jgi:hypothetical protein
VQAFARRQLTYLVLALDSFLAAAELGALVPLLQLLQPGLDVGVFNTHTSSFSTVA